MPVIGRPAVILHTSDTRDALRRIRRLEKRRVKRSVPFSYFGPLAVSTSGAWTPHENCTVYEVRALLTTAGTSSTVVTVYVNGTSVGTVTLASGVTNNAATLSTALTANTDVVTVGVTTAGTGAQTLTALLRVA